MSGKLPAIVVDVDGTVARRNNLRPDPYDMTRVEHDDPIWPVIDLARMLVDFHGLKLIIVTARENTGKCFDDTLTWLQKYGLRPNLMLMRAEKDYRPDAIVKREFYHNYIKPHYSVKYVLDDRDPVVAMWREENLTCLQVAKGDF